MPKILGHVLDDHRRLDQKGKIQLQSRVSGIKNIHVLEVGCKL